MTFRRPRRLPGCSYRGRHRYLLTLCTAGRSRIFVRSELVSTAIRRIQQSADEAEFEILAYCFMPDHLHLVVQGTSDSADLRRFVIVAKQRVAYSLRTEHGVNRTWQEGYHDWVLRGPNGVEDSIRYVISRT